MCWVFHSGRMTTQDDCAVTVLMSLPIRSADVSLYLLILSPPAATGFAVNDANISINRCGDVSSPLDNWPAERVQQVLQLSDAQYDALDKLQAAATQSAKTIRADCRDPGALTPSDRLRALVQTLWI